MLVAFLHAFLRLGPLGLFLAGFIEESVLPVPSVFTMMAGGFLFLGAAPLSWGAALFLLTHVALPIALGLTLGSTVLYLLGYHFGKTAVDRWGPFFAISWDKIEKLEQYLEKGRTDELVLTVLRMIPIVPIHLLAMFCGLIRLPLWNYVVFTFIGVFIRSYLVSFIGWRLGKVYYSYATIVGHTQTVLGLAAVGALIGWLVYRRRHISGLGRKA